MRPLAESCLWKYNPVSSSRVVNKRMTILVLDSFCKCCLIAGRQIRAKEQMPDNIPVREPVRIRHTPMLTVSPFHIRLCRAVEFTVKWHPMGKHREMSMARAAGLSNVPVSRKWRLAEGNTPKNCNKVYAISNMPIQKNDLNIRALSVFQFRSLKILLQK